LKPQKLLELVASGVLLLVIGSLGWIMLAAYQPAWLRLPTLELEVVLVLSLFTAALVLVSVVALRQTRG
jgi:hypothetical protein